MSALSLRITIAGGLTLCLMAISACSSDSLVFGKGGQGANTSSTGGSGAGGGTAGGGVAGMGGSGTGGTGVGGTGVGGSSVGGSSVGGSGVGGSGGDPCPNPVGHDEDADGRDDGCDNCPTFANPGQADSDQDGLGDVCEAAGSPGQLLHQIASFDSFWLEADGWTSNGGNWQLGTDVIEGASSPYGANATHGMAVSAPYAVETTFHYVGATSTAGENYVGVVFAGHDDGYGGYVWWYCAYERDSHNLSAWAVEWTGAQYQIQQQATIPAVDSTNSDVSVWRRIRAIYDGSQVQCTFENGVGDFHVLTLGPGDIWGNMSGDVGVRVYAESAAFGSYVIYE